MTEPEKSFRAADIALLALTALPIAAGIALKVLLIPA